MYPSNISDLSSDGPLILSGRYKGTFPEFLEVKGVLADFSNFLLNMKIQNAQDIPVQRVMFSALYSIFKFQVSIFFKIIPTISPEEVSDFVYGCWGSIWYSAIFFEL